MSDITEKQWERLIGTFCERYHLQPNGFLGAIRSYFVYACSGIAAGSLVYTDQRLVVLESEIFSRLNGLLQDADQSIAAIQFLEDAAYELCRQQGPACHPH